MKPSSTTYTYQQGYVGRGYGRVLINTQFRNKLQYLLMLIWHGVVILMKLDIHLLHVFPVKSGEREMNVLSLIGTCCELGFVVQSQGRPTKSAKQLNVKFSFGRGKAKSKTSRNQHIKSGSEWRALWASIVITATIWTYHHQSRFPSQWNSKLVMQWLYDWSLWTEPSQVILHLNGFSAGCPYGGLLLNIALHLHEL